MKQGLEEFSRTVAGHQDRIYALVLAILHDPDDAADVTQEAFLRLWRQGRDLPQAGVRPWLLKVAHNLSLDHLRRRKVQQRRLGWPDADALHGLAAPAEAPEAHELPDDLQNALAELAPLSRSVVVLHYCEGLKLTEIASLLDTNLSAVKVRLHRARHALRRALEPRLLVENRHQETGT